MLLSETTRIGASTNTEETNILLPDEIADRDTVGKKRNRSSAIYDEEVYDDRPFYSMLLKSFITSSSSEITGMRKEDILALQKYKRKGNNIDRKASKGRKIRYVLHPKLQNFMFPIRKAPSLDDSIDNRLMNSLFK